MKNHIIKILRQDFSEQLISVSEIKNMGSVNNVFDVIGSKGEYIVRINTLEKRIEYKKEKSCIASVRALGISAPKVLSYGIVDDMIYMVQEKVIGTNGSQCSIGRKKYIWEKLGKYASIYHQIKNIEDTEVEESEFHKDWKSRLSYNLYELQGNDSLLMTKVLKNTEHNMIIKVLSELQAYEGTTGLIHGDLCPRNVIDNGDTICLLDWGTAEINVVPHTEIGIIQLSQEASTDELQCFLNGLGITPKKYNDIERTLMILNLLHRLDKYRWAEGQGISSSGDYIEKIKIAYHDVVKYC